MAEFCKDCAERLFGPDREFNDACGLVTKRQVDAGYVALFLCEGCGPTQVDHEGHCLDHEHDNTTTDWASEDEGGGE